MTQIDELVKDARTMAIAMDKTFKDSKAAHTWRAVADALESQAAELTRLRERNAELEKERDEWKNQAHILRDRCQSTEILLGTHAERIASLETRNAAEAAARIASLEATVREMRELLSKTRNSFGYIVSAIEDEGDRAYFGSTNDAEDLRALRDEFENALASSESVVVKSEGENDGVE
jgi:chromosome segregation ATPase